MVKGTGTSDNNTYLKRVSVLFILFYITSCIFPLIRLEVLGNDSFDHFYEIVFALLPDIFFTAILIYVATTFLLHKQHKIIKRNAFDNLFIVFILSNLVLGFFLGGGNMFYFSGGFRIFYLPALAYFVGRTFYSSNYFSEKLIRNIFLVIALLGIAGLVIYLFFPTWQSAMVVSSGHLAYAYFIPRITSLLLTPVLFGTLISWAAIYYYYRILQGNNGANYILFAVCASCLLLTISRGAIITFLFGFILLSFINRKWKITALVLLIIILMSVIISFIAEGDLRILKWIFTSAADTAGMGKGISRVELWRISYHDFLKRPWGYGIGKSGSVAYRYLKNSKDAAPYTTDGWYLKMLCETGIYGLLSYFVLATFYFYKMTGSLIKNKSKGISTFILVLFAMVAAQNIVSNVFDFVPYIAFYWLCIGISVNTFNFE